MVGGKKAKAKVQPKSKPQGFFAKVLNLSSQVLTSFWEKVCASDFIHRQRTHMNCIQSL
jgi:hypothetical protein